MTAIELNAQIWRDMGILADSEPMMKRVAKYLRKLVAERQADPTEMTREEFFARIDEAKKGPSYELRDDETLEDLIKRIG